MRVFASLRSTLGVALRRGRFERDVADELRFHIEAYTDDLVRSGVPPGEAERRARVEFGSAAALKDELRAARGQRLFDEFRQDMRYAIQRLHRGRGPAVIAVLALGLGVNIAVFSVIHASLVQPLPHPDPDRLVSIASRNIALGRDHLMSPLDFFDVERHAAFGRVAAYYPPGFTLSGGDQAERVSGARASSGIFDVLGVRPALGRGFLPAEDFAGTPAVAVISHAIWMRRYGGDPGVIGRPIVLSGQTYTLIGVLPAGFQSPLMWPRTPDLWVPIGLDPNVGRRDARMLRVIGRLRPDVTVAQSRAELDALVNALAVEHPDTNTGTGASVAGALDVLTKEIRPSLYALAAGVLALLMVACGNAAGLLLGDALERRHELGTRLALGASRARIVRQFIAENLVVGLLAAVAGFTLALWALDVVVGAATAAGVPRASEIDIGALTFAAAAMLSIVCTTIGALAAALEATRSRDLSVSSGLRAVTPRRSPARAAVLVVEAALSLALLAGAGLLIRSFHALQLTTPGFDVSQVLTTRLLAPQARYPAGPALAGLYDRVLERVKTLPGVAAASVVDWLPASGFGASIPFRPIAPASSAASPPLAELRVVGLDYFRTIGVPVIGGRPFDSRDVDGAPSAVAVNQLFARTYFGSEDPLGRRLTLDRGGPLDVEVVGVVGDVREVALSVPPTPTIYAPKTQQPWLRHETRDLVVRAGGDLVPLVSAIHGILREIEPDMPRMPVQSMNDVVGGALARPRFYASALSIFALSAVLLAAFAIHGTVASAVAERRREIGVRLALGASRRSVIVHAARAAAGPTLVGLAVGVPLAFIAGRLVRGQLHGVGPDDWPTIAAVAMLMAVVALCAALAPATRAARIESPARPQARGRWLNRSFTSTGVTRSAGLARRLSSTA